MDIFSTQFLASLREQVKQKNKPSRALLDAMKDLSILNQNNKKIIKNMQIQIQGLKQQNNMLIEIIQSSKKDYQMIINLKNKKVQISIDVEAKLWAENQGLKKQVQLLKGQLEIMKNLSTIRSQHSQTKDQNQCQTDRQNGQKIQNFNEDLASYLFSHKQKSSKSKDRQIDEQQQFHDGSFGYDGEVKEKGEIQTTTNSQEFTNGNRSNTDMMTSEIMCKILHGGD